jgi:hypothetical protein
MSITTWALAPNLRSEVRELTQLVRQLKTSDRPSRQFDIVLLEIQMRLERLETAALHHGGQVRWQEVLKILARAGVTALLAKVMERGLGGDGTP